MSSGRLRRTGGTCSPRDGRSQAVDPETYRFKRFGDEAFVVPDGFPRLPQFLGAAIRRREEYRPLPPGRGLARKRGLRGAGRRMKRANRAPGRRHRDKIACFGDDRDQSSLDLLSR